MLRNDAVIDWQTKSLAAHLEHLLEIQAGGTEDDWWIAAELRVALESSLDVLLDVARASGLDRPDSQPALATRDTVAIHLRAAAEIDAADGRPETVIRLLVRAATTANSELTIIAAHR